jgi:hypothetical protein
LKEPLPSNQNSVFKGYHVPFIGYTYTENSLMNDLVNIENNNVITFNCENDNHEQMIKLKKENYELTNKLKGLENIEISSNHENKQSEELTKINEENYQLKLKINGIVNLFLSLSLSLLLKQVV